MATIIKTPNDLKKINVVCGKAIKNACNRLLGSLQQIIDEEFYDVFEPDYYHRTYQFWRSAITKMLTKTCGQVFIDKSKMNYNSFWTGEKQLHAANIGSHGGWITDETKEHRFWEVFIDFCEENCIDILLEELRKQGLKIR
ncbi:hypothetical protein [Roseburia sp. 1XD42-69]|uniref:hypothetical protein n=1 Tax=Roseburia sp. 1XD42-69 TaxID=2320088 RepID=UPI000EA03521|nr:hypothetical protein [Roseburia sp. 1XD42-69]RKJ68907.1 hypothetical protein D7Y06_01260 [Roseburia sp. 1XD42-69]